MSTKKKKTAELTPKMNDETHYIVFCNTKVSKVIQKYQSISLKTMTIKRSTRTDRFDLTNPNPTFNTLKF